MLRIDTSQQGYRTSVLGEHLETLPRNGFYANNTEVKQYGLLHIYEDESIVLYRTENGVAVDIKEHQQHLVLGTSNYGDPIAKNIWLTIVHEIIQKLGGNLNPNYFIPSEKLYEQANEYVKHFSSQIDKLILEK